MSHLYKILQNNRNPSSELGKKIGKYTQLPFDTLFEIRFMTTTTKNVNE